MSFAWGVTQAASENIEECVLLYSWKGLGALFINQLETSLIYDKVDKLLKPYKESFDDTLNTNRQMKSSLEILIENPQMKSS